MLFKTHLRLTGIYLLYWLVLGISTNNNPSNLHKQIITPIGFVLQIWTLYLLIFDVETRRLKSYDSLTSFDNVIYYIASFFLFMAVDLSHFNLVGAYIEISLNSIAIIGCLWVIKKDICLRKQMGPVAFYHGLIVFFLVIWTKNACIKHPVFASMF